MPREKPAAPNDGLAPTPRHTPRRQPADEVTRVAPQQLLLMRLPERGPDRRNRRRRRRSGLCEEQLKGPVLALAAASRGPGPQRPEAGVRVGSRRSSSATASSPTQSRATNRVSARQRTPWSTLPPSASSAFGARRWSALVADLDAPMNRRLPKGGRLGPPTPLACSNALGPD
jgi:hypothetical protein